MFFRAIFRRAFKNSTGHSIRLWRRCSPRPHRADMRTAPSSPERYGLHSDSCIHLHSNESMLGAWYWFHNNHFAAPGISVGSKDDVRVVSSPPSTAVERAGKLGVVNQAQSLILCQVLYQFAASVSRSIAPYVELWLLKSPMSTCCWSPTAVSGWWNEKRSPGGL